MQGPFVKLCIEIWDRGWTMGTSHSRENKRRNCCKSSPTQAVGARYRIVACLVMSLSPVPLKTRRVGQRCTLNLSRSDTSVPRSVESSRWCGS
ncbi:hypothetical protein TNCV_5076571 [Trichonephila clavipes]|uniref:Uncharacterized protein n=1 Tax=Trichonephila clavipes TaxID=2585209 RepID=A0A8X6VCK5_TRICX|nr:hypothetical protein TNCV_5076571 [Trichonephila clavipes]